MQGHCLQQGWEWGLWLLQASLAVSRKLLWKQQHLWRRQAPQPSPLAPARYEWELQKAPSALLLLRIDLDPHVQLQLPIPRAVVGWKPQLQAWKLQWAWKAWVRKILQLWV